MKLLAKVALTAALMAGVSAQALADDGILVDDLTPTEASKQYVVDIGVAGVITPKYDGADDYVVYPLPLFAFSRFYLPGFGQVKDGGTQSLFFYPSFGFVGEREPSDDARLAGTKKVDWAGEIGFGGGFRYDAFRMFAEVRHGFNGHTGIVGRAGIDYITKPMDKLTLAIGPRVDFADSDYMETYFSTASSAVVGAYSADGGFKSVGAIARVSYEATEDVSLHLQGGWDRLIGDAADSPISLDDDQFTVAIGATYRYDFNIFD
ncbi:MipA/OmpV family protein [Pseudovibrio exalbescens]|uniref:MipA/OmpV family protein n=1 Tax=Pseudovibrio exalbescens TaxID=197461 RepID=UPI00236562FE|nr:MipA/OmpV family protein [Pseudovibrio exalbescens]MDD7909356.1 MipA/OmpV family protein [Pseudovibrio exalbescens]